MKMIILATVLTLSLCLILMGCESSWQTAGLGAAGGAVAAGGSYEYVSNREMERIEQDYKDGKMDQEEYEIRKDQIQRMSLLE